MAAILGVAGIAFIKSMDVAKRMTIVSERAGVLYGPYVNEEEDEEEE